MKKDYFIPGFEPDDIHDMAKSALKQIHERSAGIVRYYCDEPNPNGMDVQNVNLNEKYEVINGSSFVQASAVSAGYNSFHLHREVTDSHRRYNIGLTIHDFDRKLDSAGHGKNVVTGTASNSKKLAR